MHSLRFVSLPLACTYLYADHRSAAAILANLHAGYVHHSLQLDRHKLRVSVSLKTLVSVPAVRLVELPGDAVRSEVMEGSSRDRVRACFIASVLAVIRKRVD